MDSAPKLPPAIFVQGGFFLTDKPLMFPGSVERRIETVVEPIPYALAWELRVPSTGVGENRSRNRRQRQNPIDSSELDRFFGHAKYHTRGLVLRDSRCAGLLHLRHPARHRLPSQ